MSSGEKHPEEQVCPHCGSEMKKISIPEMGTWGADFHYVCFNNDCSYYKKGWAWMKEKYAAHASYRYHLDPLTGEDGPLPVWSEDALTSKILEDESKE